jgi:hypothetical protein
MAVVPGPAALQLGITTIVLVLFAKVLAVALVFVVIPIVVVLVGAIVDAGLLLVVAVVLVLRRGVGGDCRRYGKCSG